LGFGVVAFSSDEVCGKGGEWLNRVLALCGCGGLGDVGSCLF
jgi:hypothetical protein